MLLFMHAVARLHRLFCEFSLAQSKRICTSEVDAKSLSEQISAIFDGIVL